MVGTDFLPPQNHAVIKEMEKKGHEIANHSMTHPQGFRWLDEIDKEREISSMANVCEEVVGTRPIGFRSPGWNIDDDSLSVLKKFGYIYDSSIFPTFLMPLMKVAHWASMASQTKADRTTMGQWRYMVAPRLPYRTSAFSLAAKGEKGMLEFPVSVTPILRIPFFATLLLLLGSGAYRFFYRRMRSTESPIHFQMHLSDFVDYSLPELQNQMPSRRKGAYVPQALTTRLDEKLRIFHQMMDMMAEDYSFMTLREWAEEMEG